MNLEDRAWTTNSLIPYFGKSRGNHRTSHSLRRIYDGIYISNDFTIMAFFMRRFWLLKIQGVTIGRFKTLQDIMDFIDVWASSN